MKNYCGVTTAANYLVGAEGVSGNLRFDETGITFKPHSFNLYETVTGIEYKDMLAV